MKKKTARIGLCVGAFLCAVAALAVTAQDKYSVAVPGGLSFSEFRGYESWQTISLSRTDKIMAVIVGNPAMIEAYESGIPGNGKPFPDGAKMAKVHWAPK